MKTILIIIAFIAMLFVCGIMMHSIVIAKIISGMIGGCIVVLLIAIGKVILRLVIRAKPNKNKHLK